MSVPFIGAGGGVQWENQKLVKTESGISAIGPSQKVAKTKNGQYYNVGT